MLNLVKPVFQPIKDINSKIICYEALMRISDCGVSPSRFMPRWEDGGFIGIVDVQMLKQIRKIASGSRQAFSLSVNVSVSTLQLYCNEYLQELTLLKKHTERLIVELTETKEINDSDRFTRNRVHQFRNECARLGISFALDDCKPDHKYGERDFIVNLRPDFIKIDGEFLRSCFESDDIQKLTAIISYAREINSTVIAEGIEQPQMRTFAFALGAMYFQGYALGKPGVLPNRHLVSANNDNFYIHA